MLFFLNFHLICFNTVLIFHFSNFLCNFIQKWIKAWFTHSFIHSFIHSRYKRVVSLILARNSVFFIIPNQKVRPSAMVTKFVFFRRFYNFFYNVRFLLIRRNSSLPIWIDLTYQVHISRCCETFIANSSKTVLRKLPKCC